MGLGMKLRNLAVVLATVASGCTVTPEVIEADENWTVEQQEVIESSKSCWLAESKSAWLDNCYHADFVGWYKDIPRTITIDDKRANDESIWTDYVYELVEFTPYKVHIEGDLAIMVYSVQYKWTDVSTGEVTVDDRQRWMEASLRENGRWVGIAEHASLMPEE